MFFARVFSSEYLPTAVFVEFVDKLFDSFNSVKHAAPGKALRSPLSFIYYLEFLSGSIEIELISFLVYFCGC